MTVTSVAQNGNPRAFEIQQLMALWTTQPAFNKKNKKFA